MNAAEQSRYLTAMGIPVWRPKAEMVLPAAFATDNEPIRTHTPQPESLHIAAMAEERVTPIPPKTIVPAVTSAPILSCAHMDWAELKQVVSTCTRCSLAKTRTKTVFGTGNLQANWMIVGEAPGADEDRQGEPFVGRAGRLLTSMLAAIGLGREQVYILNMLKCRPPNNRDPSVEEVTLCRGYLERQIELIKPKLILVVGRIAAQHLLNTEAPLARLRGQVHALPNTKTPVVVTYHPAYLLRKPIDKRKAWQDLQMAQQLASTW
ncbi:MAG: uracil-DNA glycosylase [Thiofilum sp.]|uniref:uracil-DNA glycosylase n=1 Tax=Thiofilum sp. TaxID=2212733 RepID=UPI0025FABD7A|nr:uracil-DNA glycosylase [Thiofilum sp.]MBK8455044.1 uracil-DNA glycosylase [Thiofilum sp.]